MSDPNYQNYQMERITEIQERYTEQLMSLPHVMGVGVGVRKQHGLYTGEVCLVVMVDQKIPSAELEPEAVIPRQIEGIPVDVQETGLFSAF